MTNAALKQTTGFIVNQPASVSESFRHAGESTSHVPGSSARMRCHEILSVMSVNVFTTLDYFSYSISQSFGDQRSTCVHKVLLRKWM